MPRGRGEEPSCRYFGGLEFDPGGFLAAEIESEEAEIREGRLRDSKTGSEKLKLKSRRVRSCAKRFIAAAVCGLCRQFAPRVTLQKMTEGVLLLLLLPLHLALLCFVPTLGYGPRSPWAYCLWPISQ